MPCDSLAQTCIHASCWCYQTCDVTSLLCTFSLIYTFSYYVLRVRCKLPKIPQVDYMWATRLPCHLDKQHQVSHNVELHVVKNNWCSTQKHANTTFIKYTCKPLPNVWCWWTLVSAAIPSPWPFIMYKMAVLSDFIYFSCYNYFSRFLRQKKMTGLSVTASHNFGRAQRVKWLHPVPVHGKCLVH